MFMNKSIPTSTSVEFINVEPQSPLMSKGVAKVLYLGPNRNGSIFTREVVDRMIPSLFGIPIVGKYEPKKGDFMGHEKKTQLGRNGRLETVPLTVPYGFVPENANVWYQSFTDNDSVEREYLCCDVKLWTGRYPEALRVTTQGNHQSMEIDPDTMMGEWTITDKEQTEYFMVSEAYFSALCILGQDVEPCFEGAGIASEFSLTEEERLFLFELDKAMKKVKGDYNMKNNVTEYMSVEDVKLMLQAGSGEPDVSHVAPDAMPTNGVTPADNIATPAEGLATDANFAENEEKPAPEAPPVGEPAPEAPVAEEPKKDFPPADNAEKKPEEGGEEAPKAEGEEPKKEGEGENPFPPKKEGEEAPEGAPVPEGLPGEEPQIPNAMNQPVAEGLDPVSKIDQIMVEDKDVLETELLKKILELLEGRISGVPVGAPQPVPPVENAGLPQQPTMTPETAVATAPGMEVPQPQMPVEQPSPEVAQIRRQFEKEIEEKRAEYEILEAKYDALVGEFAKLKEFKLQIEMNEKEQIIAEYSMLPQSVVDGLKEQAKDISKEDLEARCALAFVKSSKREKNDNGMFSYSYGEAPKDEFLLELEAAINKTNK